MSYILEALKKSQQERELGQVPDLMSAPSAKAGGGKASRLIWFILLGALLPLTLLILFLIFPSLFELKQHLSETALPTKNPDRQAIESPASSRAQADNRKQSRVSLESSPGNENRSVSVAATKSPPSENPASIAPQQRSEAESERQRMREELLALKAQVERDAKKNNRSKELRSTPEPDAEAAISSEISIPDRKNLNPSASDLQTHPAGAEALPGSAQALPPALQMKLPARKISVLAYSKTAERRFIILDGKKMQEGETRGDGLGVEAILPDRVVFGFEGYRFYDSVY